VNIQTRHLKRWLPIAALLLVALGVNLDRFGIDLERLAGTALDGSPAESSRPLTEGSGERHAGTQWSDTDPNINLWHVFEGEINRSGKPVGYHARPGGRDPAGARVLRVRDQPNRVGVYTADIEILDGDTWRRKFSSFFPDELSRDEVMAAILNAHARSPDPDAQPFSGPSGLGFTIQGYTSGRGGINTAYPLYVR